MTFFLEFLRQMDVLHDMRLRREADAMLLNEFRGYNSTERGGVNTHRERPSRPLHDEIDI